MKGNNTDPGVVPELLQDIIQDLIQVEEMFCSLVSPCFLMCVSRGGQYKTRGNIIMFFQNISNLCVTLPCLPEELDVLVIHNPHARDPSSYKDFHVRKHKVLQFLRFLKANNRYYANINIWDSEDVNLPEDRDVLNRLPSVTAPDLSSNNGLLTETSSNTLDDEELLFVPDQLSLELNCFLPAPMADVTEMDAIRHKMTMTGLAEIHDEPMPWPCFGEALSEFTTDGLFTKVFLTLFPTGEADYSLSHVKSLALYEWVKHLMRYEDPCFATHPHFQFFALNLIFRHRAMGQGRFLFSRNVGNHTMTVGQLKNTLKEHDGAILASKIVRCLKNVQGTRPYWHMEGAKLQDLIDQISTPTLFYTLLMADLSWPDLHKLMPEDPFQDGLTATQLYQIQSRNIANNPHIVAAYLSMKHHHLRDTILQHFHVADHCCLTDYWFQVEWQLRGSGGSLFKFLLTIVSELILTQSAGHIHGFLWLKNAPPVDELDWDDPEDIARLANYFSCIVTAYKLDPFCPHPLFDCLFKKFLSLASWTSWDNEVNHCDLCNHCQKHGTICHGVCSRIPSQCFKNSSCHFHFPYPITLHPAAFIVRH